MADKKEKIDFQKEMLVLGHLIKYNLYLLSKSIIFSSIAQKEKNFITAAKKTNDVIKELDLISNSSKNEE